MPQPLPASVTPRRFAAEWMARFREVVDEHSSGGVLTSAQATAIANQRGPDSAWGDNALNYMRAGGTRSVAVDRSMHSASRYVLRHARSAAGEDARLTFSDVPQLPEDLRADFHALQDEAIAADPRMARVVAAMTTVAASKLDHVAHEFYLKRFGAAAATSDILSYLHQGDMNVVQSTLTLDDGFFDVTHGALAVAQFVAMLVAITEGDDDAETPGIGAALSVLCDAVESTFASDDFQSVTLYSHEAAETGDWSTTVLLAQRKGDGSWVSFGHQHVPW